MMFNAVADEAEKVPPLLAVSPLIPPIPCKLAFRVAKHACAMECLFLWPCHTSSHFTWQQPFGKKTLLIWLDNLFSHINSGPTGANEKCVINVRRLNASRMCSIVSLRRGPDNYYPAALKDMRAQFSDTYTIFRIWYIRV